MGCASTWGCPRSPLDFCDEVQGLALPDDDLVDRLGVDVRGLFPLNSHNDDVAGRAQRIAVGDGEEVEAFVDEWGITQHRPYPDGLYFTSVRHPLEGSITVEDVRRYPWPEHRRPPSNCRAARTGRSTIGRRAGRS